MGSTAGSIRVADHQLLSPVFTLINVREITEPLKHAEDSELSSAFGFASDVCWCVLDGVIKHSSPRALLKTSRKISNVMVFQDLLQLCCIKDQISGAQYLTATLLFPSPSSILRLAANLQSALLLRYHERAHQLNALMHFDNSFQRLLCSLQVHLSF